MSMEEQEPSRNQSPEQEVEQPENKVQEALQDPDTMFDIVKKSAGLIVGLSVVAVAVSFGFYYVQREHTLNVFISSTLGWAGYLFAHYSATGKFIHQKQSQHLLPKSTRNILGGIFGILILTAGLSIWALALQQSDILTTILGAMIFLAGYTIAHYEFTGDIL